MHQPQKRQIAEPASEESTPSKKRKREIPGDLNFDPVKMRRDFVSNTLIPIAPDPPKNNQMVSIVKGFDDQIYQLASSSNMEETFKDF